jgi:hypothetical protein
MSDTQTRQQPARPQDSQQAENPFAEEPGNERELAAAYGNVARACRRDCERGDDAVRALHARRNNSGE